VFARNSGGRIGLHFKLETIVGQLHMWKTHFYKAFVCFSVRQVMSDVGEPRAAGLELLDEDERLVHCLMHGMWNVPESVQDQLVESL